MLVNLCCVQILLAFSPDLYFQYLWESTSLQTFVLKCSLLSFDEMRDEEAFLSSKSIN